MTYFALSPEVAGQLGPNTRMDTRAHPPLVTRLNYEFDGWLGDDLLESFPCYIGTERLVNATLTIHPTGLEIREVETSMSQTFRELYPDRELPRFLWIVPVGRSGIDDFGTSTDHRLIVSQRVLEMWRSFQLDNCDVEAFEP